jgi:hypothetical protein
MANIYYSARGDKIDLDAELIKQQLAAAPVSIEVEARRALLDNRSDRKPRKPSAPAFIDTNGVPEQVEQDDFTNTNDTEEGNKDA